MPRRDGRDNDYRTKPDSTEQDGRQGVTDRHGSVREEERNRGGDERSNRDGDGDNSRAPRYRPPVIVEEEEPEDRSRSNNRPDRHANQSLRNFQLEATRRPLAQVTTSLNRPPAIAQTTRTTLPALSSFRTLLPSIGIGFASIPVGEYGKCKKFILENPAVLEQDPTLYLREAAAAYRAGKVPHARSCIQQALLIRELKDKNPRRRLHFFELLEYEDPEALRDFIDDFDAALAALQKTAAATAAPTTAAAPASTRPPYNVPVMDNQAMNSAPRRTHDDNLPGAMSGMTILPQGDRAKYDPAPFYQGDAPARGQPDSGPGRHRAPNPRRLSQPPFIALPWKGTTIRGTSGDRDFDPNYTKRRDVKKFFCVGRVFALLWHEPAGNGRGSVTIYRGEKVYSSIRRMAVVRDDIHGACWAIPVHTYGNKGVAKRGFNQIDIQGHAVIHMTGTLPFTEYDEPRMCKTPIEVDPAQYQELEPMSRINFTKVHTVEHEVKVLNIGTVSKKSLPNFLKYWDEQRGRRAE